jgi:HKD family nuclease
MNFIGDGIGKLLLEKLAQATEVQVASAFFNPGVSMLEMLAALPSLDLVISEEFTINDPYKLERLLRANVRSFPMDHADGKLHAKVFIAKLTDESYWALLGSANLTQQGLFANQEACVELHSSKPEDRAAILDIRHWFQELYDSAGQTDMAEAKRIFDQRSRYRLELRPTLPPIRPIEYWAIKTTSGGAGAEEHWPRLLSEGIVAIGWEELSVDPSIVSEAELRDALRKILPPEKPGSVNFAVDIFNKFINMPEGSIIVLCRGFTPNQKKKPVHIYAFARVTGPFRADPAEGTHWRFKRNAVIQEVGVSLPVATVATALGKESFRLTMHSLSQESVGLLAEECGIPIEV